MGVICVLGAGGATGLECVKAALASTSHTVRAAVRSPDKHGAALRQAAGEQAGARLEVVAADVTDPASLARALDGASGGVIFAAAGSGYWSPKAVDDEGVANVIAAARAAPGGCGRIVLVSSMLVHPANRFHPIRVLLNNIRYSLMDAKHAGEEKLRACGLPYTIVRPSGLTNAPPGRTRLVWDADATKERLVGGSISRADVAAVCVEALGNAAGEGRTLSLSSAKGGEPLGTGGLQAELGRLFGSLR